MTREPCETGAAHKMGCGNIKEARNTMVESEISLYLHFGGVSLMNSAENSIKEKVHYSVILNDDLVYSFAVSPPSNDKNLMRVKMADYKQIHLSRKGQYNLTVLNKSTNDETKSIIEIDKVLWIHFDYVIYPENHDLKAHEGIQINIHKAPQKYR
jgi:hypothetical protein